jgi:cold shock CspA family protein
MALTTHIVDEEVALQIRSKFLEKIGQNEKLEHIRGVFSAYLTTEDQKYSRIPTTPEFARQGALRSEFMAHWAGVDRIEQAEEIALYGLVAERVVCTVDWFDKYKGFGFVKVAGNQEGAFLHVRVLEAAGLGEVIDGDALLCDVSQNDQGLVVSAAYEIIQQKSQVYRGKIAYLNAEGAYGFVAIKEVGADAFLRYSLFPREQRAGLAVGNELLVELTVDNIGRYQVKKVHEAAAPRVD